MSATEAAGKATRTGPPGRRWLELAIGFLCIFAGLSLPVPLLARCYTRAHEALGNVLLPSSLSSGVELTFRTTDASLAQAPWSLPLLVRPLPPQQPITVPIDLRALLYLPSACFVALALATPLRSRRRNLLLLGSGLVILQPLLLGLVALPVLSFLGGTGPVQAFELSLVTHTVLQILYRALLSSPGMTYVLPLFLWWILVVKSRRPAAPERAASRALEPT